MSGPRASRATPADLPEVAELRRRVFVEEQGVPAEIEQDAADATAVHAVSRDPAGRVVATGRLLVRHPTAVIGRMAADAAARGRGHGAAVLDELHWQAVLAGVAEVELHAQLTARGFYERAGYAAVGEEYEEAGIAHVTMRRRLPVLRPAGADDAVAVAELLGPDPVGDGTWVLADRGRLLAAATVADAGPGGNSAEATWGRRLAAALLSGELDPARAGADVTDRSRRRETRSVRPPE